MTKLVRLAFYGGVSENSEDDTCVETCMNATVPECVCSCGGKNHASHSTKKLDSFAEEEETKKPVLLMHGRKTYNGSRVDGDLIVTVKYDDSKTYNLRHIVHHSPTGFECGYGGSGPADLALSILVDVLKINPKKTDYRLRDTPVHPRIYQDFEWEFISPLPTDKEWSISEESIIKWLKEKHPDVAIFDVTEVA